MNAAELDELRGHPQPRIATPMADLPTLGADVVDLALLLGEPLLPWQAEVMRRAHLVKPDGTWQHSTVAVIVARQSGKTHAARLRLLTGLFVWGERLWLGTAQNRDVALETFRAVVDTVRSTPWLDNQVDSIRMANGQEELRLRNGARYKIVAPSPHAARGLSADGLLLDEARELRNHDVFGALAYTTQARPNPQVWLVSNAGDAGSVVLNEHRDRGRRLAAQGIADDPLCWLEWSAPEGAELDDPVAWAAANPALGHTVRPAALAARAAQDPPNIVRTEMLCQWVDELVSPWPDGAWSACADPELDLQPGAPTWLAVDTTPDRTTAALVAGQQLADGRVAAKLLHTWSTSSGAVDQLVVAGDVAQRFRELDARVVLFDRWTSSAVADRLQAAGIPTEDCSGGAFARACDQLLDAMASRRLVHPDQDTLTQHVRDCARKPAADGGWRIIRQKSSGPVTAACALAMVVDAAAVPPPEASVAFA